MPTEIGWTDETWNPTTGCDRVSPGCDNCYIERTIPFRVEGRRFDEHGKMGVRLHPDRLDKPLHWRKPRRVFVNSLSDLFHPDVPDRFISRVFQVMGSTQRHTYQVLTKRQQRMAQWMPANFVVDEAKGWPGYQRNVWLGTSIENDRYTFRADHLRATPAAVRFLSCEPLIGPLPSLDLTGIDWCIIGGESGPGARPMDPEWARDIVERCDTAGVAVFVKQAGKVLGREWGCPDGHGADWSTWPEWARRREFPLSVSA
jgi:protein gp37